MAWSILNSGLLPGSTRHYFKYFLVKKYESKMLPSSTTTASDKSALQTAASREAAADRERVERLETPTAAAAVFLRATERCWERGVRDGPGLSKAAAADADASVPFEEDFGGLETIALNPAESSKSKRTIRRVARRKKCLSLRKKEALPFLATDLAVFLRPLADLGWLADSRSARRDLPEECRGDDGNSYTSIG